MALKIEMLRCFATVARSGNLSDAAHSLGRTPSAVSMMLKQLETHLGEPLFETDRKNKLTALGAFVLEEAERELQQFDHTVKSIEGFANATHGHVRIATVPSIAGTLIPQVFSRHIKNFDQVSIDLRDMDSTSIRHELSRNRIDIGIASLGEKRGGLHSQLLLTDAFGVLCPPNHALAQDTGPVRWDALKNENLIANSLSARINAKASQDLHESSRFSAHNLTSIFSMVSAEIGITILPELAARTARPSNLVFRPLADSSAKRQIHLLRKADSALSPAARLLESYIIETATALMEREVA